MSVIWAGHVARMTKMRSSYKMLVWKAERKGPLERSRNKWKDDIEIDLEEVRCDDAEWIRLAQNTA